MFGDLRLYTAVSEISRGRGGAEQGRSFRHSSSTSFHPLGHITLSNIAPLRSAPDRFATSRFAVRGSAPEVSSA